MKAIALAFEVTVHSISGVPEKKYFIGMIPRAKGKARIKPTLNKRSTSMILQRSIHPAR